MIRKWRRGYYKSKNKKGRDGEKLKYIGRKKKEKR